MSNQETQVLNYWRKKYLFELLTVIFLVALVVWAAFVCFDFAGFKLLTAMVAVVLVYLMAKAIKEDLQVRGEGIVLARKDAFFSGLAFDFGRGLNEKALDEQNVVSGYRLRECHNVMKGENFILEEDWLYSLLSAKFFSFSQTAFEGIILAIDLPDISAKAQAKVEILNAKVIVSGDLAALLKKNNADQKLMALCSLFHAKKADVVAFEGKLYVWIKTETRIFYQFKLCSTNTVYAFIKRVNDVRKAVLELALALKN